MVAMIRAAQEKTRRIFTRFRSSEESTGGVNLVRRFKLSFICHGLGAGRMEEEGGGRKRRRTKRNGTNTGGRVGAGLRKNVCERGYMNSYVERENSSNSANTTWRQTLRLPPYSYPLSPTSQDIMDANGVGKWKRRQ